jgi:hypothetical protein
LGIRSNIFLGKRAFDDPSLTVDVYRIEGISNDKNRFRNIAKVKEMLARRLKTLAVLYSPGDADYAVVFQPQSTVEIKEPSFSVKLEQRGVSLVSYPQQLRELHYEATRHSLEKYGLWKHTYNRYFEAFPEKVIDDFEIYRGLWFRYDLIGNNVQLSIDLMTRVTSRSTVWELISRFGKEEAKKRLAYRNVLATQEKVKRFIKLSG